MKRWILPILLLLLLCTACDGSSLADGFDEEEVYAKAEEVLSYLHAKDTASIHSISTVMLKEGLPEETMEKVYAIIEEAGAYDAIEEKSIGGTTNKDSKEEFAVVVMQAKYELKNITYTLSFTKQMKLAGLFLK